MRRVLLSVVAVLTTLAVAPAVSPAAGWTPYDRPAQYQVVTDTDVPIMMRDGIVLVANVYRPDKPGKYPVLVTQTPYGKGGALAGANTYLVQRGYVHVVVDVRGTGGSEGQWDSFGEAEQRDGPEIIEWAARQDWSDGKVGTTGPSYMGFTQILTAAQHPPHLKAIFPVVPMADSYRDITFSGGQLNVSFIPLWLGLVTGASLTPPTYAASGNPDDLVRAFTTLASHASGITNFSTRTVAQSIIGGDMAFDGPFWKLRSPIEVADQVNVPAFVVGGLHDLFQRGEPLLYERMRQNVEARLLMGPWTHLGGSTGAGLPRDGVPSLNQIELRWFDRYLRGIDTHIAEIPRVTQYVYGDEKYETQADWPDPKLAPSALYLHTGGQLTAAVPTGDEAADKFFQHPVSGVCTQSTSQWTAGVTEQLPCTTDDRLNEAGEKTFTTAPMKDDLRLSGPITARLWTATTASDAVLSVRVTDVAPDGASKELSGGWLAASMRATTSSNSRMVRGKLVQPFHPFSRASVLPVKAGEAMQLDVEVFPLSAVIKKGHSLRVSVGPSDFPHAVPPLPQLANTLAGEVSILHDAAHPSLVELPTLGAECTMPAKAKKARSKKAHRHRTTKRKHSKRKGHRAQATAGCRSLAVPRLLR